MKCPSCLLLLVLAAFVPLDCRQKPDQQPSDESSVGAESPGGETPADAERPRLGDEPRSPDEVVADTETHIQAEAKHEEPLLLLDEEEPLLLDDEEPLLLLDDEEPLLLDDDEDLLLLDDDGVQPAVAKKPIAFM